MRPDQGRRGDVDKSKLAVLLLPGIGTQEDLKHADSVRREGGAHRHPLHRGRHLRSSTSRWPRSWAWRSSAS